MTVFDYESHGKNASVLRILIGRDKTVDDVIAIARVQGKKKYGCDVAVIDIDRRSDTMFWVEVRPRSKYPSLDVEARKTP